MFMSDCTNAIEQCFSSFFIVQLLRQLSTIVLCRHSFSLRVVVYIDVYEKKGHIAGRSLFFFFFLSVFAYDDSIIRIDLCIFQSFTNELIQEWQKERSENICLSKTDDKIFFVYNQRACLAQWQSVALVKRRSQVQSLQQASISFSFLFFK